MLRAPTAATRRLWEVATFGTPHPGRRLAGLAIVGAIAGFGEAAVVILVIALVSGDEFSDYPLASALPDSAWANAALALGALGVLAAAHLGVARLAARSGADVQRTLQRRLVGQYLDAPWPVQATVRAGELQDLVSMKVTVLSAGTQEAAQALAALVNIAVLVVAAIVLSPWAAAALLAAVVAMVLISRPQRARRRLATRRSVDASTTLALEVTEHAAAARDLRVFGSAPAAGQRLDARIGEAASRMAAVRTLMAASAPLTRDATLALLVLGLAVVVTQTGIALPTLASTVVLMLRALGHSQSLTGWGARLQEREENVGRIEASLAAWHPPRAQGTRPCPRVDSIVLRAVGYTHPGADRPALEHVSLELARGDLVGIVGRTGAGKSTLAGTLLGLLPPDSGAVLVDGVTLAELDPGDWHARTAWVGQEPHLLSATVRENIRFLRPDLDDEAILEAARAAGLDADLERWPDGLDHHVGPRGGSLSGGERQRVAFARALAGRPDLLVLDEPASALDTHSEAELRATLERAHDDLIVVVIAHRLTTVRICDRIAVMESGRIVSVAPPAELERSSDYFQQVLALSAQSAG
jgi:ABC-type multidrug transport system fused ATPase/permease subunit